MLQQVANFSTKKRQTNRYRNELRNRQTDNETENVRDEDDRIIDFWLVGSGSGTFFLLDPDPICNQFTNTVESIFKQKMSGMRIRIRSDPLIFCRRIRYFLSDPDPDPTCNNRFIKLFSTINKFKHKMMAYKIEFYAYLPKILIYFFLHSDLRSDQDFLYSYFRQVLPQP